MGKSDSWWWRTRQKYGLNPYLNGDIIEDHLIDVLFNPIPTEEQEQRVQDRILQEQREEETRSILSALTAEEKADLRKCLRNFRAKQK